MEQIRTDLSPMLSSANALLDHCVEMITIHPESISKDSINDEIVRYRTSHAICVKACKLFRASIGLAGIGSAEELNILSRVLFETFIALSFVLQEKLKISKNLGEVSPETRAKMYLAHGVLKRRKKMRELKADPNWTSTIPNESVIEANADQAVNDIGDDLADRLMGGNKTYSTLSLRDLITRFEEPAHLLYWYNFLYSDQSQIVHASDPTSQIEFDAESSRFVAKWFGSTDNVGMSLGTNGILIYGCFLKLHEYCSFNENVITELNQLCAEIQVHIDHCSSSSSPERTI